MLRNKWWWWWRQYFVTGPAPHSPQGSHLLQRWVHSLSLIFMLVISQGSVATSSRCCWLEYNKVYVVVSSSDIIYDMNECQMVLLVSQCSMVLLNCKSMIWSTATLTACDRQTDRQNYKSCCRQSIECCNEYTAARHTFHCGMQVNK